MESSPTSTTSTGHGEIRDREEARACFEKAIEENPDDSYSLHQLGLLYEEEYRDVVKAREFYTKAVEINNSNFAAWSSLGTSFMKTDPQKAVECFDTALSINNTYCRALKNRGIVLLRAEGRVNEALESLTKALRVDPLNASVMIVLGEVYEGKLNDTAKAEKYFRGAIQADDSNPNGHVHLAQVLEKYGQYEAARKSFEKAIEQDPFDWGTVDKYTKLIEGHFSRDITIARYLMASAAECAPTKPEELKWRGVLRRLNDRCKLTADEAKKTATELLQEIGMLPWLDRSSTATQSFDAERPTEHECPRRHRLTRIYKKPREYKPRSTWACEECKRSIGGPELAMQGALFCRICKYDLCDKCSFSARAAHLLPMPPRRIGQGGAGVVYKEFSRELGIYCAVKYTSAVTVDAEKEVRLMLHFQQHPNVVKVYSYERKPTGLVIWMELMRGSVKSQGVFHERAARRVIRDALRGLCALHSLRPRPVIHRDIKPDNLLVAADGTVKLSDFGISKHVSVGTTTSPGAQQTAQQTDVRGTPQFLAPECFNDPKPIWTPAADIWALACTWVSICTGKPPYAGREIYCLQQMYGLFLHQGVDGPAIPSFLSKRAQALLSTCFTKNFKARPTAFQLLDDPYFAADDVTFEESVPDMETMEAFAERTAAVNIPPANQDTTSRSCEWVDESSFTFLTEEFVGNTPQNSLPPVPLQMRIQEDVVEFRPPAGEHRQVDAPAALGQTELPRPPAQETSGKDNHEGSRATADARNTRSWAAVCTSTAVVGVVLSILIARSMRKR